MDERIPVPPLTARRCAAVAALLVLGSFASPAAGAVHAGGPGGPGLSAEARALLEQARAADPERYAFALREGARIVATPDRRSFLLVWAPGGSGEAPPRGVLVTLSGHASFAFDELYLWHPFLEKRGLAVVAVQWWLGSGERTSDYYSPEQILRAVRPTLRELGGTPGTVLLHGFSRGSTNTYALTALDAAAPTRWLGMAIANAGGVESDYPPTRLVETGHYGPEPLAGTRWVLYCGMRDPKPDQSGCPAMRRTRAWVVRYGGMVDRFIADAEGDHGGFHRRPRNVERALDAYERFLAGRSR